MQDFQWKKSNYKQMNGKWKIGVLLEAGYRECEVIEMNAKGIKLTDRIYFQNMLSPYPKSEQLLPQELKCWCKGIELVSEEIERCLTMPYIMITLRNIQYSDCNIQNEAFTAAAIQWASEIFEFSMPEIRVYFDENINFPYGQYIYEFN